MPKKKAEEEILQEEQVQEESAEVEAAEPEQDKSEEYLDKLMRLTAEFDNYRKRTQKEKESLYNDGMAACATEFLPLADNLERCVAAEGDYESLSKGIELILKQLKDILKKISVEEIPAVGEEFNPEVHNAVMHIEDESIDTNTVVEEFQKGYIMKGKVIRHSMVKVAN